MNITVRMESTTVWPLILDKFNHCFIYKSYDNYFEHIWQLVWMKIYLTIILSMSDNLLFGIP